MPKQFYESRCRTPDCGFSGALVDVVIDYRTPYETGYTWVCPKCGNTVSTEFSFPDD